MIHLLLSRPQTAHPSRVFTAYGPSSWLCTTSHGSDANGAFIPINNPTSLLMSGIFIPRRYGHLSTSYCVGTSSGISFLVYKNMFFPCSCSRRSSRAPRPSRLGSTGIGVSHCSSQSCWLPQHTHHARHTIDRTRCHDLLILSRFLDSFTIGR